MIKILPPAYFQSKNTPAIAEKLLGKFLVRRYRGKTLAYMITETEAYDGFKDKASHAYRGKTKRNKVMFGKAGHWYVYFTYGMHWMLNIVTGPERYPAAVLIRGIDGINGPARLTKALHISKNMNGKSAGRKSGLWLAAPSKSERASPDYKNRAGRLKIKKSPRIGVAYAGPVWSRKKYRFFLES